MYKVLLCWRYLRTRYLAMVCIVSVMLGVATLIVVNSVMAGFSTKLRERLHGLVCDVVLESYDVTGGFADPDGKMRLIRSDPFLNERIEALSASLEIFAMLQFNYQGTVITRPVHLIGIDPESRSRVGGFAEHVVDETGPTAANFDLTQDAKARYLENHRPRLHLIPQPEPLGPEGKPAPEPPPSQEFVPEGLILGHAIGHYKRHKADIDGKKEMTVLYPGDDAVITTVSGVRLNPVSCRYTVSRYFRSEMSEYDSNYVFVPLAHLQKLRTMEDRVSSIQIRLKNYDRDKKEVVERLQALFPYGMQVQTWEDKQGPLLAAIGIEKGILNILLFLIIAVAGFGILAIFSMIVVEKTKDIGILKALGASNAGVLKIFLGYGLLLGLVGALLGTTLGVSITVFLNEIEKGLSLATGQEIFPRDVYYFDRIPTYIHPLAVTLVNVGSVAIAVLFSVLPAFRAALLHPVRALRYE